MTHTELHAGFLLLIRDLVKAYDDGLPYEDFTEECVKLCDEHTSDLQAQLAAAEARVTKATELIAEIVNSPPEWEDPRIDYDSIQRDKTWLDDARKWLAAEPRKEHRDGNTAQPGVTAEYLQTPEPPQGSK